MPTGYTAYIEDGSITTGKEFLKLCSRAFGVAIDIKDEPLSVLHQYMLNQAVIIRIDILRQ